LNGVQVRPNRFTISCRHSPEDIAFKDLVAVVKMRRRIERDYLELKQEVGLGHY
jgi:SRSO17 transposase